MDKTERKGKGYKSYKELKTKLDTNREYFSLIL